MAKENKTVADIIAEMRGARTEFPFVYLMGEPDTPEVVDFTTKKIIEPRKINIRRVTVKELADRLEAAHKREADSIHRAMVILAGIEMPDPDYPPKLWTALEDAYDALSDALGTDGETTADEEEAKANGRHFVIQPRGDCAKLREAVQKVAESAAEIMERVRHKDGLAFNTANYIAGIAKDALAALAAPPRNCDVYNNESCRMAYHLHGDGLMTMQAFADWLYAPATEKEGGAK